MSDMSASAIPVHPVVVVTGPAGAGRSTAIHALEDLGFEAIDNLPLSFAPRLLDGRALERPIALGIDPRTRDFTPLRLTDTMATIAAHPAYDMLLLYLDCRPDILLRRFSETRRRHPFSRDDAAPAEAIERERALLSPLRDRADLLIDTSRFTPHELRAAIAREFDTSSEGTLGLTIHSFSYRRGVPQELDLVFDVRFLANPHWVEELRPRDGTDEKVQAYIAEDVTFRPFFERITDLLLLLLPAYRSEGKAHLALGFGCTGGKHRSVALAERTAKTLADAGWRVSIRHRELERRGDGGSSQVRDGAS